MIDDVIGLTWCPRCMEYTRQTTAGCEKCMNCVYPFDFYNHGMPKIKEYKMSEEYRQLWCQVCHAMTEHEDGQCMREHSEDNDELLDDIEIIIEEDDDE